jgi:hypothetical protein
MNPILERARMQGKRRRGQRMALLVVLPMDHKPPEAEGIDKSKFKSQSSRMDARIQKW